MVHLCADNAIEKKEDKNDTAEAKKARDDEDDLPHYSKMFKKRN